jgi:tetratricopeptide (TPR) repeat protein
LVAIAGCTVLLAFLAMRPAAAQSAAHPGDLATLRSRATDLLIEGRLGEAVVVAERARSLAERRLEPRDPELALTLSDLAYLYFKLGRHGDAETLSGRALAIYDGASERPDGKLWSVLGLLAQAYSRQGRTADALAAVARVRAIEQAVSAPFESEVAAEVEIITTDLKRLRTHDCGAVSFQVDDAPALLSSFDSFARVRLYVRLQINSALRKVVGSRSSAQVVGEADLIGRELKAALDQDAFGYSVRATPDNIASCLKAIN